MTVNGHPSSNRKPTLLETIKKDYEKNPAAYHALGVTFVAGLAVGVMLKRAPVVDKSAVLNEWLREANASGINVYGLTNEQKKLWETIWKYVEDESKYFQLPTAKVVSELISDYGYVARNRMTPMPSYPRPV